MPRRATMRVRLRRSGGAKVCLLGTFRVEAHVPPCGPAIVRVAPRACAASAAKLPNPQRAAPCVPKESKYRCVLCCDAKPI